MPVNEVMGDAKFHGYGKATAKLIHTMSSSIFGKSAQRARKLSDKCKYK